MLLYWILLPIVWVLAHILWRFEVIGREHLKSVQDGRPYVIAAMVMLTKSEDPKAVLKSLEEKAVKRYI